MLKKVIEYTDFNGVERKEPYYFNLTQAEVMEMELSTVGGFTEMIQKIIDAQDMPALIALWKEFILEAYGEKSLDGKQFMKEDTSGRQLSDNFKQTGAYSVLFMELATDTDAATAFINGVVPDDTSEGAKRQNLLPGE